MLVFRISLTKYAGKLIASGNAARWSLNDVKVIYTASSRSLACLENVVHRTEQGLLQLFSILTIECPDNIKAKSISLADLPADWMLFDRIQLTREIGDRWIKENQTAILQVPSAIVNEEVNYLINPAHPDFGLIKLVRVQPFIFDGRIKQ